ncbi:MAG: DUF3990 domain-containing protein [Muribaculaceae bacterium]|nr:DUF3990 domain-containing protein [Muribaculaceae bacterium]
MEVYHGGTEIIDSPKIDVGRPNLDFGPGFYVTTLYSQAKAWSQKIGDERNVKPIINKYEFNKDKSIETFRYLIFPEYNEAWLQFVCDCRLGKTRYIDYDIIEGGVADDRVRDTVRLFMTGFISMESALSRLKYFRPNNQICILNQDIVTENLKFVSYEVVG